ncbi:MAG: heparinase II/III family protein [Myxococcota bacterium]|jgi:hypothetical protein
MNRRLFLFVSCLFILIIPACSQGEYSPDGGTADAGIGRGLPPRPDYAPSLLVRPQDKQVVLSRIEREPFRSILDGIRQTAGRPHLDLPPDTFDSNEQYNGETAQAAAFLAWLFDDAVMAKKARDFMAKLSDNYASHADFDIDIRMPSIMMCYVFALDMLAGAKLIPDSEAKAAEKKLTTINDAFFNDYVMNEVTRTLSIWYTQNNHPIRTACSIATAALAYPDHPSAGRWANWAFSELNYLWGADGCYVQPDGGVSEGPFYYIYAFTPSIALSVAWRNRVGAPRIFSTSCINRQTAEPWGSHKCRSGVPFVYNNLFDEALFVRSIDWSLALSLPDGRRPPMEDANMRYHNGIGVMAGVMNRPDYLWDWVSSGYSTDWGLNLAIQHLVYAPDAMTPVEPAFTKRVMTDAGQAVFRSGWGKDAIWVMLTAEAGDARMTVHDHVDAGSFTMAAYGEYLVMDTGYYKPNAANNAVTAQAPSHNVLMIEGESVPPKGLLLDFGDTDAFLKNESLTKHISYVEAWQTLKQSTTQRSVAFVRDRYVVTADRIVTPVTDPRLHTWRMHGYAGHDSGGTFAIGAESAAWERASAGVAVYLASTEQGLSLSEPAFTAGQPPHVHKIDTTVENHGVLDGKVTAVTPGFLSVVAPYRVGAVPGGPDAPLKVERITATGVGSGVAAWAVTHAGGSDLVVLRSKDAPTELALSTGDTLSTDAEVAIVALDGPDRYALIARGGYCRLNGVAIIENATGEVAAADGE